jgi:multisubunit Na+/H+ antiporter MnhB subunit
MFATVHRRCHIDEFGCRAIIIALALVVTACSIAVLILMFIDRKLIRDRDEVWLRQVRIILAWLIVLSGAFLAVSVRNMIKFLARRHARIHK